VLQREVLREILGPERRVEKLYSEELHDLCFGAELWHLGVWENSSAYRVLVGRLQGRDTLQDMGIVGRIILKCISKEQDGRAWSEFVWLGRQTRGGVL
jgi:hypothetical protein